MNVHATTLQQQIENTQYSRLVRWRAHIERALQDSDLITFEDIARDVLGQRKLLLDNGEAFAIVEIHDFTKGRVCHILAAGGSLAGIHKLQEAAIPFFKLIGARRLSQTGRPGWTRVLSTWGWKQPRVVMELPLDDLA